MKFLPCCQRLVFGVPPIPAVLVLTFLASSALCQDQGKNQLIAIPTPTFGYTYNPYGSTYVSTPAGDYIRSLGDYKKALQESNIMKENARLLKLTNRRNVWEQLDWERDRAIKDPELERRLRVEAATERARFDPPWTEIQSGTSLNVLRLQLELLPLSQGASIPIERDCLVHINFNSGNLPGNAGILKADSPPWTLFLRQERFAPQRKRFEELFVAMKNQVTQGGRASDAYLLDSKRLIEELLEIVRHESKTQGPSEWNINDLVMARSRLMQMYDALRMLENPDALFYLKPLQGNNVAELVEYMKGKGLRFDAATEGETRHYQSLHRKYAEELNRVRPAKEGQ